MRLLFEIDTKDYDRGGIAFVRPSARGIIIREKKIAMIHSIKYNYYKFPGGGIEDGETGVIALIRETAEEAGLCVIPSSVKEFGYVHRIQKTERTDADYFVQDNFYYLCDVEAGSIPRELDDYEAEENFTLEWVFPEHAIYVNRNEDHSSKDMHMIEREAKVLNILIEEGFFI